MELPFFEQVADVIRALTPQELGELKIKTHRRGLKVWFNQAAPPKEHYEAQLLPRRYVDSQDGHAIEIGFHAENADPETNQSSINGIVATETKWRKNLGPEAEVAVFFGADNWRRISEAWLEPDLDDPELAFEVASRMVDYVSAIEPARASNG